MGGWVGRNPRGLSAARGSATRRCEGRRGDPHSPRLPCAAGTMGPDVVGRGGRRRAYEAEAPAAFAASRTAPATAPATLSLKTLGMM